MRSPPRAAGQKARAGARSQKQGASVVREWDAASAMEMDGIPTIPIWMKTRGPSPVFAIGSAAPSPFRLLSLNLAAPPCRLPITSQLSVGLFAAKPCGALTDYALAV